MGRIIPYIMENKKCLKSPTRIDFVSSMELYTAPYPKIQCGPNKTQGPNI
jgi:hypothetical protein